MRRLSIAAGTAVVLAGVGVAASSVSAHPSSHAVHVKTRHVTTYGTILTTSNGRTLYLYTADTKGHSHCSGSCAVEWPPLIVPKGAKVSGVSGLGTIKRGHKRQAALHGKPLYRFAKLAWFIERFIQLPSTHRAHHAEADPQGQIPLENYAQTLFLWDTLFKTGRFPRGNDPARYGIRNDPKDTWRVQLWWPAVRAKSKDSVYSSRSYWHHGA